MKKKIERNESWVGIEVEETIQCDCRHPGCAVSINFFADLTVSTKAIEPPEILNDSVSICIANSYSRLGLLSMFWARLKAALKILWCGEEFLADVCLKYEDFVKLKATLTEIETVTRNALEEAKST